MKFNNGRPILAFFKSVASSFISSKRGNNDIQCFATEPVVNTKFKDVSLFVSISTANYFN